MTDPTPVTEFDIVITTPDQTLFEGKVKKVFAPGYFQDIAILPDHTPLYSELKKGEVVVTTNRDQEKKFPVEAGIIRVKQNKVSILLGFN